MAGAAFSMGYISRDMKWNGLPRRRIGGWITGWKGLAGDFSVSVSTFLYEIEVDESV